GELRPIVVECLAEQEIVDPDLIGLPAHPRAIKLADQFLGEVLAGTAVDLVGTRGPAIGEEIGDEGGDDSRNFDRCPHGASYITRAVSGMISRTFPSYSLNPASSLP